MHPRVSVIAAGGALVAAPQRREWGGYTAYVADPEGYRWEIAHNPTRWARACCRRVRLRL